MAYEFPQRCGRLDCELLYPRTLLLPFRSVKRMDSLVDGSDAVDRADGSRHAGARQRYAVAGEERLVQRGGARVPRPPVRRHLVADLPPVLPRAHHRVGELGVGRLASPLGEVARAAAALAAEALIQRRPVVDRTHLELRLLAPGARRFDHLAQRLVLLALHHITSRP